MFFISFHLGRLFYLTFVRRDCSFFLVLLLLFFFLLLFKLLFKIVRLLDDCRVERRFFKQYESVVYVDFFDDFL